LIVDDFVEIIEPVLSSSDPEGDDGADGEQAEEE